MARWWNHNTYYHRALLRRLPRHCDRALDVGCGDGTFAHALAGRCDVVVALDPDAEQARTARGFCADRANVEVVHSDLLTAPLEPGSFDAITALASLHHLPLAPALARVTELLRPHGTLLVLGVWTDNDTRVDMALNRAAATMNRLYGRLWGPDRMDAPAVMLDMSLRDLRRTVARLLPGATIRRRLLWRYILSWQKPG